MANKINKESKKNVIETLNEIKAQPNMNCGIDEIEFPDGTKEKFYFNGEDDRQAAIKFATICVNATDNTQEAKRMMYICFQLMTKNVNADRIVEVNGCEYYLDHNQGKLFDGNGYKVVGLTEEEMALELNIDAMALILKERAKNQTMAFDMDYDDDYDDEKEDY